MNDITKEIELKINLKTVLKNPYYTQRHMPSIHQKTGSLQIHPTMEGLTHEEKKLFVCK